MKEGYGAKLKAAQEFIAPEFAQRARVGIVLGSGFSSLVNTVSQKKEIPYGEIPFVPSCSVEGHRGVLVGGEIGGVSVAILCGRIHAYEGYQPSQVVFPLRVLALLGIEVVLLTNAAGGIDPNFCPGDFVLMEDHINLTGTNPFLGPEVTSLGPRFVDMGRAYDPTLRGLARESADGLNIPLKSGVYVGVHGPSYETPAEMRMMRALGGQMVGMSSVLETMAAVHMGLPVLGISCIANRVSDGTGAELSHGDIKKTVADSMGIFTPLFERIIEKIGGL